MRIIIPLKLWDRGAGMGQGRLLHPDGRRCILGHVLKACGVEDETLMNQSSLISLPLGIPVPITLAKPGMHSWVSSMEAVAITACNDNEMILEEDRIRRLTSLFLRLGYSVEFTNEKHE